EMTVDGRRREAVVQLTKQAIAYVLDRETGEPIWPTVETPAPVSDVPAERSSPTQPIPTKPAPYDRHGFSIHPLIDFTPELRADRGRAGAGFGRAGRPQLTDPADPHEAGAIRPTRLLERRPDRLHPGAAGRSDRGGPALPARRVLRPRLAGRCAGRHERHADP